MAATKKDNITAMINIGISFDRLVPGFHRVVCIFFTLYFHIVNTIIFSSCIMRGSWVVERQSLWVLQAKHWV